MTEDAPFLPSLSPVAGKKVHVALERNSCTKATANRFRLLLHTAAELLLHTLRGLAPRAWHDAQFDTLRLAFVKVAARVTELVTRTEVSLPSTYPYKTSTARIADRAQGATVTRVPPPTTLTPHE